MQLADFTLRNLQELEAVNPKLAHTIDRLLIDTYDDFIGVLYRDIDNIVAELESNRELRHNDSEDRLTVEVLGNLKSRGYDASHDEKHGGHTDLLVKHSSYSWIGEAKIHRDYKWLLKGFNQLTTRYSTGTYNQCEGGVLIYFSKTKDVASVMRNWADTLDQLNLPKYSRENCINESMSFYSTHLHEVSGLPFKIKHIPVLLYFSPKDR